MKTAIPAPIPATGAAEPALVAALAAAFAAHALTGDLNSPAVRAAVARVIAIATA